MPSKSVRTMPAVVRVATSWSFEEVNVAGVVEDAGDVGGEEEFAVAEAEDDGRAEAGGDHLVGRVRGEDADGEGSGEALDGAADGFFEGDDGVGGAALFVEDGDGFVGVGGVGGGGEGSGGRRSRRLWRLRSRRRGRRGTPSSDWWQRRLGWRLARTRPG